jgi:hypothetical protein
MASRSRHGGRFPAVLAHEGVDPFNGVKQEKCQNAKLSHRPKGSKVSLDGKWLNPLHAGELIPSVAEKPFFWKLEFLPAVKARLFHARLPFSPTNLPSLKHVFLRTPFWICCQRHWN